VTRTSTTVRPAGVSWEVYGHWDDDPVKRRTGVYVLLEPVKGCAVRIPALQAHGTVLGSVPAAAASAEWAARPGRGSLACLSAGIGVRGVKTDRRAAPHTRAGSALRMPERHDQTFPRERQISLFGLIASV